METWKTQTVKRQGPIILLTPNQNSGGKCHFPLRNRIHSQDLKGRKGSVICYSLEDYIPVNILLHRKGSNFVTTVHRITSQKYEERN